MATIADIDDLLTVSIVIILVLCGCIICGMNIRDRFQLTELNDYQENIELNVI